jgi:hypothetical protein
MSFEASSTRSRAPEFQNVVPSGLGWTAARPVARGFAHPHCFGSLGLHFCVHQEVDQKSPMIAGMAITAAEPSGLWGVLKESFAGASALAQAMTGRDTNALVSMAFENRVNLATSCARRD